MVGKHLTELTYEIDTLRKDVETVDKKAYILCNEDGTLVFGTSDDDFPQFYWCDWHEPPHDKREDYASIARFVPYLKKHITDPYTLYLLSSPVWCIDNSTTHRSEAKGDLVQLRLPMGVSAKVIDFKTRGRIA